MEAFQAVPKVVRFWRRIRGEYLRASGEHMFWRAMYTGDEEVGRKLASKATAALLTGVKSSEHAKTSNSRGHTSSQEMRVRRTLNARRRQRRVLRRTRSQRASPRLCLL
jgi:hypothetical protein